MVQQIRCGQGEPSFRFDYEVDPTSRRALELVSGSAEESNAWQTLNLENIQAEVWRCTRGWPALRAYRRDSSDAPVSRAAIDIACFWHCESELFPSIRSADGLNL